MYGSNNFLSISGRMYVNVGPYARIYTTPNSLNKADTNTKKRKLLPPSFCISNRHVFQSNSLISVYALSIKMLSTYMMIVVVTAS